MSTAGNAVQGVSASNLSVSFSGLDALIPKRWSMDTTTSSSETRCKNPSCGRQLPPRASGGHRQREYCDDTCRQAARRARLEGARRQQCVKLVRSWDNFQAATVEYLAGLVFVGNQEGARRLAALIVSEQQEQQIPARSGDDAQEKLTRAAQQV